jgi:hypothetical protein
MHRRRFGPWFETRSFAALLTMRFYRVASGFNPALVMTSAASADER